MKVGVLALVTWAGVTAVQAQAKASAGGIFTCVDASGHRLTSDRPIVQCADREQRVLGHSGIELRRIGPALTEAEMAQRLEARRLEQQRAQRLIEQRRRNAALLSRYPSAKSHEAERQSNLLQFDEVQRTAEKRLEELKAKHAEQSKEQEFYANDPSRIPASLRLAMEAGQRAEQEQQRFIDRQIAEKKRIHQRFDEELQRLQPMWDEQSAESEGDSAVRITVD